MLNTWFSLRNRQDNLWRLLRQKKEIGFDPSRIGLGLHPGCDPAPPAQLCWSSSSSFPHIYNTTGWNWTVTKLILLRGIDSITFRFLQCPAGVLALICVFSCWNTNYRQIKSTQFVRALVVKGQIILLTTSWTLYFCFPNGSFQNFMLAKQGLLLVVKGQGILLKTWTLRQSNAK